MQRVARVFDAQNRPPARPPGDAPASGPDAAWEATAAHQMPPMMFQLRHASGARVSFAFSDLREVRTPHAGSVELYLVAMSPTRVRIEGRRLTELASLFSAGLVRWVREADPRGGDLPEDAPAVLSITVEPIAK